MKLSKKVKVIVMIFSNNDFNTVLNVYKLICIIKYISY